MMYTYNYSRNNTLTLTHTHTNTHTNTHTQSHTQSHTQTHTHTHTHSFDAVTAGSNGYLHLWREGQCVQVARADKASFVMCVINGPSGVPYVVCSSISGG